MSEGDVVADASAILAVLKNEPIAAFEPERLVGASVSSVNLCEVRTKLHADGLDEAQTSAVISAMALRVVSFDAAQAAAAAAIWSHTRRLGLSLGDRACLALGRMLGRPVVTADRAWSALDLGLEIVLIR